MMKKLFILSIVALSTALSAMAVPARPRTYQFTQSDGTTITLSKAGDEWHSSYVTVDGLTVARDDKGDFYYSNQTGLTQVKAHNVDVRGEAEKAFVAAHAAECSLAITVSDDGRQKARANAERRKVRDVPQTGSPRIPVVLVQYKDIKFKDADPMATFTAQFTEGPKSAYQYFEDQSFGKYKPQFDVIGPINLSNNRSYYGAHTSRSSDARVGTMVAEGCQGAGNVDWSQYDNDGNGSVDVVVVLYAGVGEADSDVSEAIWPCQWYLTASDYGEALNIGGTTIDKFAVFNELLGFDPSRVDGIGTFCHEFSHCLGLPDFYPTDYSNHFGMGSWSLLHYGCYANDGYTPCGYTAYERSFMGWYTINTPLANTTYTLDPLTPELQGKSYRVQSDYNANEYYILECRAKTGWDLYLPASGLQVTHVFYNAYNWNNNKVNNGDRQGMTIIPADNLLKTVGPDETGAYSFDYANQVGDLFPYKDANKLTDVSTPAANLYVGGKMGKPITDITKNGWQVSFTFMPYVPEPIAAPVANEVGDDNITSNSFTASWSSVSKAVGYVLNVIKSIRLVEETFSKATTASSTAISNMDKYADMAGWRASTVYPEVGGVRLGNNSKVGYLRTPDLDLTESSGDVIITVKAKPYGSDKDVELQVYVAGNTDGAQKMSLDSTEKEYTFIFNDVPQEAAQSFVFANVTKGKRVVVTDVNVIASGAAPLEVPSITATQYEVTGLVGSTEYMYMVKAVGSESESEWSNSVFVTTKEGQAFLQGDVNGDGLVSGADVTALYNNLLDGTPVAGNADVNGDGVVSGADVTSLYTILLQ